jgi:hypothetical protein
MTDLHETWYENPQLEHTEIHNFIFLEAVITKWSKYELLSWGISKQTNETPLPESASELHRPSDSRLSAKSVRTRDRRRALLNSVLNPWVP